jgi:hypothetical protein
MPTRTAPTLVTRVKAVATARGIPLATNIISVAVLVLGQAQFRKSSSRSSSGVASTPSDTPGGDQQ